MTTRKSDLLDDAYEDDDFDDTDEEDIPVSYYDEVDTKKKVDPKAEALAKQKLDEEMQ